ncbi:MAG: hypothetical protein KGD63_01930 [Candidatus Lokiarchaeota archaeon]|nr:hypothetical protein [Candidatus Lokiarchaeota archaeon]
MPSLTELIKEEKENQESIKKKNEDLQDKKKLDIKKKKSSKLDNNEIKISSDNIRTASSLLKLKKSTRKQIPQIFEDLREFFNTHILDKKGKSYYFVKK